MPNSTPTQRSQRFSRLFELIRQHNFALAVQHSSASANPFKTGIFAEHQTFLADAMASLQCGQSQHATG